MDQLSIKEITTLGKKLRGALMMKQHLIPPDEAIFLEPVKFSGCYKAESHGTLYRVRCVWIDWKNEFEREYPRSERLCETDWAFFLGHNTPSYEEGGSVLSWDGIEIIWSHQDMLLYRELFSEYAAYLVEALGLDLSLV